MAAFSLKTFYDLFWTQKFWFIEWNMMLHSNELRTGIKFICAIPCKLDFEFGWFVKIQQKNANVHTT